MVGLGNLTFQAQLLDLALLVIQTGTVFHTNLNISIYTLLTFLILAELLLLAFWSLFLKKRCLLLMLASNSNMVKSCSSFSEN